MNDLESELEKLRQQIAVIKGSIVKLEVKIENLEAKYAQKY